MDANTAIFSCNIIILTYSMISNFKQFISLHPPFYYCPERKQAIYLLEFTITVHVQNASNQLAVFHYVCKSSAFEENVLYLPTKSAINMENPDCIKILSNSVNALHQCEILNIINLKLSTLKINKLIHDDNFVASHICSQLNLEDASLLETKLFEDNINSIKFKKQIDPNKCVCAIHKGHVNCCLHNTYGLLAQVYGHTKDRIDPKYQDAAVIITIPHMYKLFAGLD
jgi:hypothetical protein